MAVHDQRSVGLQQRARAGSQRASGPAKSTHRDARTTTPSRQPSLSPRQARACNPSAGRRAPTGTSPVGATRVSARTASARRRSGTAGRLYWTPRGVAAMVIMVLLTVSLMLATAVGSFLAVSGAPPRADAPAALVLAAEAPVRGADAAGA